MSNLDVTIAISEERIQDLLCGALEGGSNYWYVIKTLNYPDGMTKESLELEFPHLGLPFVGGSLTIGDPGGQMPDKILDMEACLAGLRLMAEKYPNDFADFLKENDDANTSDVFLQLALYGEVIFA